MPASVSFSISVLALTRDLGEGRVSRDAAGLLVGAHPNQRLLTIPLEGSRFHLEYQCATGRRLMS